MEFSSKSEMQKISALADEFFRCVLTEYEPLFVSDEATIWDVSMCDADELVQRCSAHYGHAVSRTDLDQPLWKLLRQLEDRRGGSRV